jgi:hypothetical protein
MELEHFGHVCGLFVGGFGTIAEFAEEHFQFIE